MNPTENLLLQAKRHMEVLCTEIPERRVGGEGNRRATDYARRIFDQWGWKTESTRLTVMDWTTDGASLLCGEESFEVLSSPYANGCTVEGELVAADTLEKLRETPIAGKILLLHGRIASEQIMPKNFVFYNPEEHQQIIATIEEWQPLAIICATGRNSATAGGAYPFPLFEDGDFDVPSVYMKDTEGDRLRSLEGQIVSLHSQARRIPETANNIVARMGHDSQKRIVVTAHIDAKIGTPGAIDNATGVTVLFLLADLLKNYSGSYQIELVAFNGEDYYAVPGQMKYIEQNQECFDTIALNINIDGAGYREGPSCFSAFGLPVEIAEPLERVIRKHPGIVEGLPWVQGDHSIFIQMGCPAIAVSSDWFIRHMEEQDITHTPKDHPGIVNYERIPECALGIRDLILKLG